jgi:hypothetical protein
MPFSLAILSYSGYLTILSHHRSGLSSLPLVLYLAFLHSPVGSRILHQGPSSFAFGPANQRTGCKYRISTSSVCQLEEAPSSTSSRDWIETFCCAGRFLSFRWTGQYFGRFAAQVIPGKRTCGTGQSPFSRLFNSPTFAPGLGRRSTLLSINSPSGRPWSLLLTMSLV